MTDNQAELARLEARCNEAAEVLWHLTGGRWPARHESKPSWPAPIMDAVCDLAWARMDLLRHLYARIGLKVVERPHD